MSSWWWTRSSTGRWGGFEAALPSGRSDANHPEGTVVVIAGPRFSTRAESQWYMDQGWHVIGMTQMPEAALAAELRVPFAGIALVTDYDAGLSGAPGTEPVTMEEVFATVERNAERVRGVLFRAIDLLDDSILTSMP